MDMLLPRGARSRLLLASLASFILATLAFIHFFLYLPYFLGSRRRSSPWDYVSEVLFSPGYPSYCEEPYALTLPAFIVGLLLYVSLYYVVSLGLLHLTPPRYRFLIPLMYVMGLSAPAIVGLEDFPFRLYYPVYTVPSVFMEVGFRSLLLCKAGLTLKGHYLLETLPYTFPVAAQTPLILTLLAIYIHTRRSRFLVPLIISLILPTVLVSFAIVALVSIHFPPSPDGGIAGGFIGFITVLLTIINVAIAPIYGALLWGILGLIFLGMARRSFNQSRSTEAT
jgi:hypothetical protein